MFQWAWGENSGTRDWEAGWAWTRKCSLGSLKPSCCMGEADAVDGRGRCRRPRWSRWVSGRGWAAASHAAVEIVIGVGARGICPKSLCGTETILPAWQVMPPVGEEVERVRRRTQVETEFSWDGRLGFRGSRLGIGGRWCLVVRRRPGAGRLRSCGGCRWANW